MGFDMNEAAASHGRELGKSLDKSIRDIGKELSISIIVGFTMIALAIKKSRK